MTVELELPAEHSAQERVQSEARRFNVVACGRRWGKTVMGEWLALEPALNGKPTAWITPNYKYLIEPWEALKRVTKPIQSRVSEQEKRIVLKTGGGIDFWTADNGDPCRGYKYARVIGDEWALVKNSGDVWNKAVRPSLSDFRGDAWFLSTPRGQDFFWQMYTRGQDASEQEWASWQMPTSTNPFIHPDEINAAKDGMPERAFMQEYLAQFIEESGGVFRGVSLVVDKGRCSDEPPKPDKTYQAGCDLARVEDFFVLTVFESTGRQVYFERFNQISWERMYAAVETVCKRYRCPVVMDVTGVGDPPYEEVRKRGVNVRPYHFTNATKEALIDNAAMMIERGRVSLMDVPQQTAELQAYQYELTPSRNVTMNAPEGMHDDCVIGAALALWGLEPKVATLKRKKGSFC